MIAPMLLLLLAFTPPDDRVAEMAAPGVLVASDGSAAAANASAIQAQVTRLEAAGGGVVRLPSGTFVVDRTLLFGRGNVRLEGAGAGLTTIRPAANVPVVQLGLAGSTLAPDDLPDLGPALDGTVAGRGHRIAAGKWLSIPFQGFTHLAPRAKPDNDPATTDDAYGGLHSLRQWTLDLAVDFGAAEPPQYNVIVGDGQQLFVAVYGGRLVVQAYDAAGKVHVAWLPATAWKGVHRLSVLFDADRGTLGILLDGAWRADATGWDWPAGVPMRENLAASWKFGGWSEDDASGQVRISPDSRWTLLGARLSKGLRWSAATLPASDADLLRKADESLCCLLPGDDDPAEVARTRQVAVLNGRAAGSAGRGVGWRLDPTTLDNSGATTDAAISGVSLFGPSPLGIVAASGLTYGLTFTDCTFRGGAVGLGGLRLGANYITRLRGRTVFDNGFIGHAAWLAMVKAEGTVEFPSVGLAGILADRTTYEWDKIGYFCNASPSTRWFAYIRGNARGSSMLLDNEGDDKARGPLEAILRVDQSAGFRSSVLDLASLDYACTPTSTSVVLLANAAGAASPGYVFVRTLTSSGPTNARAIFEVRDPRWQGAISAVWMPPAATPYVLDATPLGNASVRSQSVSGVAIPSSRPLPVPVPTNVAN